MCCQKSRPQLPDLCEVKLVLVFQESGICGVSVCSGEWGLGSGLQTCAGALLLQTLFLPVQELVGFKLSG